MTISLAPAFTTGLTYTLGTSEVAGVVPVRFGDEIRLVNKEVSVSRLSSVRLRRFAAVHRPPQSWYDEDMEGLY
jgi:hypothetical protein